MDEELIKPFESQDWEHIIKDLTYYTYSRLKFWNLISEKSLMGLTAEDIAIEAIELVLTGKWNWDPSKSDLLGYLKFHVVKGLVANLAKSKRVKSSSDKDVEILPVPSDFSIEENLNAEQVLECITEELQDRKDLLDIFMLQIDGIKRAEICKTLKLELKDFDNLIRQLKNRLLKIEKKEQIKSLRK